MSSSRHPVALELERLVGDSPRLLATVMLLPLVDGIFPALVLAGALETVAGMVQVGLLVFGGSATVAIILAELSGTPRDHVRTVLLVGAPLVVFAAVEAALAPTIQGLVELEIFRRFAALVIAAVAAKTASARIGEYLPRPAVIVLLGLVASVQSPTGPVAVQVDPTTVARGVAAGAVGVAFALAVAAAAPRLRETVDIDRFRFGSAVALGLLPLSLLGLPFGRAPLAVLAVTAVFAYDPDGEVAAGRAAAGEVPNDRNAASEVGAVADDGDEDGGDDDAPGDDGPLPGRLKGEQERAPWL